MPSARLPDTLYLPARAEAAIKALRGGRNQDKDCLPCCLTDLTGSPPRMAHTQFDFSDHAARVIDALLLARALTGSTAGEAELERLKGLFFDGFAEDGLHYTPENRWSFHHANMHYQRSVLNALLALVLMENSDEAQARLARLVGGLSDISLRHNGFAYFPSVEYFPDGWPRGDWGILGFGVDPANTNGRLIFGLTRAWEVTGDEAARELAAAYAAHVMNHSSAYGPDGAFATGMEFRQGHFHSRAVTMLGVIRYGHATGDQKALAWGRRVFEWARAQGTNFGWYPERLVESRAHGAETCAIVDMMEAAIWLAKSGWPEYWEVAECILRNHLVESQLLGLDGLELSPGADDDPEWETTTDVARRSEGGFAGWSMPNDFFSKVMHEWDLYTCCSAQGVRGLFNAWTQAVTAEAGRVSVNLLINHLSEAAVVRSWLPGAGRLEVVPFHTCEVRLRLPSWVDEADAALTLDRLPVAGRLDTERFLSVPEVPAGATLSINFPVAQRREEDTILGITYASEWHGDTVMRLSPEGVRRPLYRREAGNPARLVERDAPGISFHL